MSPVCNRTDLVEKPRFREAFLAEDCHINKTGVIVKILIRPCLASIAFPGKAQSIIICRQSWNRPLIGFLYFYPFYPSKCETGTNMDVSGPFLPR